MTSYETIPVPPGIGEVLADPTVYQTWALTMPAPASTPRVRRPGRMRRTMAAAVAVVAAAGRAALGAAPTAHGATRPAQDGLTLPVLTFRGAR